MACKALCGSFMLFFVLSCFTIHSAGQPIPPPRKDCIPGYQLCYISATNSPIGKIGALTYGFLVHLKQAIDVEKVALGQGPAGVTGTDNAENFNPYIDPASIGPSVGRKMLLRAA